MEILSAANSENGYGSSLGIIEMCRETISYNFRQELAHQIIAKEQKEKEAKK